MIQKFVYCCISCALSFLAVANIGNDTLAVDKLLRQSASVQRSNVDSCYLLAVQALQLSEKIHYPKGIAAAYIKLSSVMMIVGKNDSSAIYARNAIITSVPVKDHLRTSHAYLLLSYIYQYRGQPDSSLAMIYKAQYYGDLARDSGNLVLIYIAMGSFYAEYKDYPKALLTYQKAYQLSIQLKNVSSATDALGGIANVYYLKGNYQKALGYYFQVDSLSKSIHETTGIAQNLNNIALCYADLNQPNKALHYYNLALSEYVKFEMKSEEANLYYNVGCLYETKHKYDSVLYYMGKSKVLAEKLGELDKVAQCIKVLAKTYAEIGDFTKAYQYQTFYAVLNDSILNIEKINSISEMQTKYETELKSSEIKILQTESDVARLKASRSLGINFGLGGALVGIVFVAFAFYSQSKKKQKLNNELFIEKKKSDDLLLNILPAEIAEELKQSGVAKAKQYNHVTVLFTDFVNFTGVSMSMSPTELVEEINLNFTVFDAIIEKFGLEKIKTIGDAYLAVCGLPHETADHAQRVAKAALEIQRCMNLQQGKFTVRIGIHTGSVVAGIVGVKKYAYDIWGDTVNTAARMEQHSEAGKINISGATYELIKNEFECEYRGKIQAKNKGEVDMYFVNRSLVKDNYVKS